MSSMKYILQILASLGYTAIVSTIIYFVTVVPTLYIFTLSWWKFLLLVFFLGWIIWAIMYYTSAFVMIPYVWICKKNIVATGLSIILLLTSFIKYAYFLFTFDEGQGAIWYYSACVVISLELLSIFTTFTGAVIQCYDSKA